MAGNQSFLYNTSTGGASLAAIFNVGKPTVIRAAGLTQTVDIYMMVGDCPSCRPEDILWTPMISNGKIVQLSSTNNYEIIFIPGRYSLGNPLTSPLVLVGDVNITKEEGVDPSIVGKYKSSGSPVDINPIVYTETLASVSRIEATTSGIITSGAESVSFINVGSTPAIVNGVSLLVGESVNFSAFFDHVTAQRKVIPDISYIASLTGILHISDIR